MACQHDHRSGWRRPKGYRLAVDVARARTHCHDGFALARAHPETKEPARGRLVGVTVDQDDGFLVGTAASSGVSLMVATKASKNALASLRLCSSWNR